MFSLAMNFDDDEVKAKTIQQKARIAAYERARRSMMTTGQTPKFQEDGVKKLKSKKEQLKTRASSKCVMVKTKTSLSLENIIDADKSVKGKMKKSTTNIGEKQKNITSDNDDKLPRDEDTSIASSEIEREMEKIDLNNQKPIFEFRFGL